MSAAEMLETARAIRERNERRRRDANLPPFIGGRPSLS
jgi:hypothetical protein